MELAPIHLVSLLGFVAAMVFGAVANRTHFCIMGAVSDWVNMGSMGRFRAWVLAIAVAVILGQAMYLGGWVDLTQSIYLTPSFGWLGYILGGVIFGIGMTLGGGCGQRTLVRVGGAISSRWWCSSYLPSRPT
ncbi:MAG: YeeE/YedE family protein [Gammaproteobacteria bacterium]|nr:YeeE/YedE family protein [Gammaproteobacteria bacterium]